jgi:hypothetical protein
MREHLAFIRWGALLAAILAFSVLGLVCPGM